MCRPLGNTGYASVRAYRTIINMQCMSEYYEYEYWIWRLFMLFWYVDCSFNKAVEFF